MRSACGTVFQSGVARTRKRFRVVGRHQRDGCDQGGGGGRSPSWCRFPLKGTKDEYFISEADLDAFLSFEPQEPAVNFIPYRDTYLKGQREVVDRFVPPNTPTSHFRDGRAS